MTNYSKTEVNSMITVKSIVTVFRKEIKTNPSHGESHDFPEIYYVENGTASLCVGGKAFTVGEGQIIIYAPNAYHESAVRGGVQQRTVGIISFETDIPLPDRLCCRVITLSTARREMLSKLISDGEALFERNVPGIKGMALRENADPLLVQMLKNRLELFLIELYVSEGVTVGNDRKTRLMTELTAYLLSNLDRALTIDTVCREMGISNSVLRRLTKEMHGCGPMAYFTELKIKKAKQLLKEGKLNITEIANALGFCSVHHFSKQFKSKTGMTPTEFSSSAV